MSYNGSGTFQINTSGQPVVAGTVISSTAFNALTADLATGLSTAITKDGQTTTTARIPFAQGINSSLATDSSSTSTGSIITAGGVGIAKNLYVGVNANIAGTLSVTGSTTLTNPVINNIKMGYTTTATAAGTTTLTVSSNYRQFFTGTLAQTIVLPVTSTLVTGMAFEIENNSTGLLTVNSSGGNLVGTIPAGVCAHAVCIGTTLTTAADWDWDYISTTTITGTGANVLGTSPTITTPTISSLSSAAATALTLQSAGTTAITVDTSQNVGIGTSSPKGKLTVLAPSSTTLGDEATSALNIIGNNGASKFWQIGFGAYDTSFTYAPAAIGYVQTTSSGYNNGALVFATRNVVTDTAPTEAMRIDSSGNVLIGVTSANANGGVLQLKSGITFPATQVAATDANTLDDYEEGTWTPAEANVTLASAVGHYQKIGNKVTAWGYLLWPATADANNIVINGLPFSTANAQDARSAFITYCNAALLLSGSGTVFPLANSTQSQLYKADANRATNANMTSATLHATWVYYV